MGLRGKRPERRCFPSGMSRGCRSRHGCRSRAGVPYRGVGASLFAAMFLLDRCAVSNSFRAGLLVCAALTLISLVSPVTLAQRNAAEYSLPAVVTVETRSGTGSGFFIHPEGYFLSNEHLVRGQQQVTAVLLSGERVGARVVFSDSRSDVAVLLLERRNVPTLRLADADALVVGDEVYAIGAPLALSHSVTRGIVSGVRQHEDIELLQTDAAVNPGNSGGPLVNERGEVVGMITFRAVDSDGIAFAVSSPSLARLLGEVGLSFNTALSPERMAPAVDGHGSPHSFTARAPWTDTVILILALFGGVSALGMAGWATWRVAGRRRTSRRGRGGQMREHAGRGHEHEADDIEITLH